jgi:hypothetical protein
MVINQYYCPAPYLYKRAFNCDVWHSWLAIFSREIKYMIGRDPPYLPIPMNKALKFDEIMRENSIRQN